MTALLVVLLFACNETRSPRPAATSDCKHADADADGWNACVDCDDTNPSIHPHARDIWYDGVDSDCAGNSDFDQDGDDDIAAEFGRGQPGENDCDDLDPQLNSLDLDGDGLSSCEMDCDDSDPSSHLGADPDCDTEADNNCDEVDDCAWVDTRFIPVDGLTREVRGTDAGNAAYGVSSHLPNAELVTVEGSVGGQSALLLFPSDLSPGGTTSSRVGSFVGPQGGGDGRWAGDGDTPGMVHATWLSQSLAAPNVMYAWSGPATQDYDTSDATLTITSNVGGGGQGALIQTAQVGGKLLAASYSSTDAQDNPFGIDARFSLGLASGQLAGDLTPAAAFPSILFTSASGLKWIREATADYSGDGVDDFVLCTRTSATLYIAYPPDVQGQTLLEDVASPKTNALWAHHASDVNGDGAPDLAVEYSEHDGQFGPGEYIVFGPLESALEEDIAQTWDLRVLGGIDAKGIGDFDGDGSADLLLTRDPPSILYGPVTPGVLDATADADAVLLTGYEYAFGLSNNAIPVQDQDDDGIDDILVSNVVGTEGYGSIFFVPGQSRVLGSD